jgi:mannitol operon repressor
VADEGTLQQPVPDLSQLDRLLSVTDTPNRRLFAFLAMKTIAHQFIAKSLTDGKITASAAGWWASRSNIFDKSPPSNFVDLLATLYELSELAVQDSLATEEQRAILLKLRQYLHTFAFSPPENILGEEARERAEDLKAFAAFVREFQEETDRGAALVGAALVNNRLEQLLRSHFLNDRIADKLIGNSGSAPLGAFSAQIDMCYALGLITKIEYDECDIIRRVRNKFAHQLHGLSFEDQQISDWCGNLKAMTYPSKTARERFINTVITLCMVLWYRPSHATPFKAQDRKWPWHLATDVDGKLR